MTDRRPIDFTHLGQQSEAVVIGVSGGIGGALTEALTSAPGIGRVHALSRSGRVAIAGVARAGPIDIEDERSIAAAAASVGAEPGPQLVIVATGMLHAPGHAPEKTWRDLSTAGFERSFALNATGPALVAKHFLPLIPRRAPAVFAVLSARVGSISDNQAGGWYSYRASKAALNQILKCLAIEEGRRRPGLVIAGLQPGTVESALSAPFRGMVREEDRLSPAQSAAGLLATLSALTPAQSGQLFDWKGEAFAP
ncbi:MAG: SDR family NAD(P)-dependent oxidoreductase [Pseudomonadota bacterium]